MSLILIDREHAIPDWYKPTLIEVEKGYYMDKKAASCLRRLLYDGRKHGLELDLFSAYRTPAYQKKIFDESIENRINEGLSYDDAYALTDIYVAQSGHSEHNAGLAIDIANVEGGKDLDGEKFTNTKEFLWLKENAYKYGFILRYPKGKENITTYEYEPWHYRYVGNPYSEIITKKGLALEEYLDNKK